VSDAPQWGLAVSSKPRRAGVLFLAVAQAVVAQAVVAQAVVAQAVVAQPLVAQAVVQAVVQAVTTGRLHPSVDVFPSGLDTA
jgi:hypothetical protein